MDPYQTLGISRTCTREEVKAVFRVRAWHAHPDRGGEDGAFIRLCTAYKQILEDLDRRPSPGPTERVRARRSGRPAAPTGPARKPDLVFLDEVQPIRWPPKPSDPNWNADLILLDEAPPDDPPWEPSPRKAVGTAYRSWLRNLMVKSAGRRSVWRSDWVGTLGTLIVLAALVGSLWGCWLAWDYAARQAELAARIR